jgi:hypothetical protein
VKNRHVNTSSASNVFHKVEKKIRKLFDYDQMMYHIEGFNEALDKELTKLAGFGKQLPKEIEDLLFYIFEAVEKAIEDGYLYDDHGDQYYTSQLFDNFVSGFVASLGCEGKTSFLSRLDALLSEHPYSTFEGLICMANSVFADNDLPHLKNVLIADYKNISQKLCEKYYERVKQLLSYNEKTVVLDKLSQQNNKRVVELASFYDSHGELSKAIETMKTKLTENDASYYAKQEAYIFYLELLKKGKHDASEVAADAIRKNPNYLMLFTIKSLFDYAPDRYELLLKQKNAGEYLRYLEKENRLSEALALIKENQTIAENLVSDFFKLHKTVFPNEAEAFFSKVIDKNLPDAGNHYYETIADAIVQLKKVNPNKANEYLIHIRTNYKRRRNLMELLEKL